jgi:hypothetical protein
MKKLSGYLALAMSMAMMADTSQFGDVDRNGKPWDDVSKDLFIVCPKGCFKYYFNSLGYFTKDKPMDREEYGDCIFTCVAINDKSAIKKFNKIQK